MADTSQDDLDTSQASAADVSAADVGGGRVGGGRRRGGSVSISEAGRGTGAV